MLPLYEMFANAQNGNAIGQMARQFGLSQKQTEDALAALMPAFSIGLKRNASDPMGVGAFLQALATGDHAKYFEDMSRAFTPPGIEEGNGILGHLFGSKEVSRAVAAQAAQMTGLGQEILKQMLPVIASTMMGGLYKQSTGQLSAAMSSLGAAQGNVIGQVIEEMMRQQGEMAKRMQPRAPEPAPATNPFENPFGKALEQMFGGGATRQAEAPQQKPAFDPMDNPWGRMFQDMMKGGFPGQPQARQPEPQPEPEPAPKSSNPYGDLFGQMFETGRKTQESYQRNMDQIFDTYLKGMQQRR